MRLPVSVLRKVPQVTIYFWIVKVLTTAMGEVTSDFLVHQLNPIIAVVLGGIGLAVALILQFWVRKYVAWIYWLAALMVAVFGTMVADVLHIVFGVPYLASALFLAVCLAVIFATWYKVERTLSIHSINTPRREFFYWATVITTFALGTAVGDMTAITFNLGYFSSGIMFAVLIAIPALAYLLFNLNAIFSFWLAYILTRPLGASFADWVGKPQSFSGLGIGTGWVSLVLGILIAALVGYLTVAKIDIKNKT